MMDAARLASPAGEGILWHPSSLADIYDMPERTLLLFDYYRLGAADRHDPWHWFGIKDKRSIAHQYVSDWRGDPQPPARCGYSAPEGATLTRSEVTRCAKCMKLSKGEPDEPTGTVAGVRVGSPSRHQDQEHRQAQA